MSAALEWMCLEEVVAYLKGLSEHGSVGFERHSEEAQGCILVEVSDRKFLCMKQERHVERNMRRVCVTINAVEKQKILDILSVCLLT
jgi:hypothetical protein